MLNRYPQIILIILIVIPPLIFLSCQQTNVKPPADIPVLRIEPYQPCDSTSPRIEIQKKVANGLILKSVSRFPGSITQIPQHLIDFNFISNGSYTEDNRIDIYVSAQNRRGKILIGHTWIPREHPPVKQWKQNVCFPVACQINLPLSHTRITWDIQARIRVKNGDLTIIDLGRVTLG